MPFARCAFFGIPNISLGPFDSIALGERGIGLTGLRIEVAVNQPDNHLSVVFDARGAILLQLAARPGFNDPNALRALIQLQRKDMRPRPTTMEVEPAVLGIDEPSVIHVDGNVSAFHAVGSCVGKNVRHIEPLAFVRCQ